MSTNGPVRRRRGAVAREEALEAARDLLLSGGPAAVTLKAVGERMGEAEQSRMRCGSKKCTGTMLRPKR